MALTADAGRVMYESLNAVIYALEGRLSEAEVNDIGS